MRVKSDERLVDGASDKFLARPGFSGDQNGGVRGSDLGYARKQRLQRGRSSDDLLEHRGLIDFFSQSNVLTLESLFHQRGIGEFAPLGAITEEHFDKTFNANVKGFLFTVQKALPLLRR